MDLKDFIKKLQGLEEKQKKIILWAIVGILAVIMGFFWIKSTLYRLENMESVDLQFPQLEDVTGPENQINDLEEKFNQLEENNQ